MKSDNKPKTRVYEITENEHEQRIDNFLIKMLKGVPKTRIYKAVRSGEVRVNKGRVKASRKLQSGDRVRIPPIRYSMQSGELNIPPKLLDHVSVLFEDDCMMVVDKPSGLAVHGGTGMQYGLIEAFRQLRPELKYLELVHRLDRETSGCLMLAKDRTSLLHLQAQLGADRSMYKQYKALVKGDWGEQSRLIKLAMLKNVNGGDDKKMIVNNQGQIAISRISRVQRLENASLLNIELKTGRMHQARVHCASSGFPIAGDRLYGCEDFNRQMKKIGLGRLFLHAESLTIQHPKTEKRLQMNAPLPKPLIDIFEMLKMGPAADVVIKKSSHKKPVRENGQRKWPEKMAREITWEIT